MDADICNMFNQLSIGGWSEEQGSQLHSDTNKYPSPTGVVNQGHFYAESSFDSDSASSASDDSTMMVTDSQGNIQFISSPEVPASAPVQEELGCGLLQMLRSSLDSQAGSGSSYPPTPYPPPSQTAGNSTAAVKSVNFLETILTHREAFVAFPYGHRSCSQAFTQLAFALERNAGQPGAVGDIDTAIALHNEAWLMSGWSK